MGHTIINIVNKQWIFSFFLHRIFIKIGHSNFPHGKCSDTKQNASQTLCSSFLYWTYHTQSQCWLPTLVTDVWRRNKPIYYGLVKVKWKIMWRTINTNMIYVHWCACDKPYLNKPAGSKTSSSYGIFEKNLCEKGCQLHGFQA